MNFITDTSPYYPKIDATAKPAGKIFTQVETPAQFPGGDMAWARYIKKIIEKNIEELSNENKFYFAGA